MRLSDCVCICLSVCLSVHTRIWGRISRKRLKIEPRHQTATNRKWPPVNWMVTSSMTSRDPERSRSWPQYLWGPISRKRLEIETSNLACGFVSGMPSGRENYYPWTWAWPRSRDPTIFGIRSNISRKLLELDTSNLVCRFVSGMPSGRANNFPPKWAWPRSRDPYNFWRYGRLS